MTSGPSAHVSSCVKQLALGVGRKRTVMRSLSSFLPRGERSSDKLFLRNWFQDRAQVSQGRKRVPILASQRNSLSFGGKGILTSQRTFRAPRLGYSLGQAKQGVCPWGWGCEWKGGPFVPGGVIDNSQGDEMNFKKMISTEKKRKQVVGS